MKLQGLTKRRHRLMELIGDGGLAVLPAALEQSRSRDTLYKYVLTATYIT